MKKPTLLQDAEYILSENAAWIEVKNFAIRINATDEGVVVDIYREGNEWTLGAAPIASTYAFDND